jgi:enamine deaminase RidA (YjgF/YER057c/UK114 family)
VGRPVLITNNTLPIEGKYGMAGKLISSGSKFETDMAYSRAVVEGDWIFVSGTTGFNYATMEISDDVAMQTEQTFLNIKAAMEKAGFGLEHIVRVHYILPNATDFQACWPILKTYLGDVRPAATMFVAGLADPRMKIEIEVTGKKTHP